MAARNDDCNCGACVDAGESIVACLRCLSVLLGVFFLVVLIVWALQRSSA
jgi:hypothetical protein